MKFHLSIVAHYRHFLTLFVALTMLQFLTGCGDGRGERLPVSGIVTIDGAPLTHGSVTFLPVRTPGANTRPGGASLGEGGRFSVSSFTPHDGLLRGKYEVMVSATEPISETKQRWHAPKKYANAKTSGFTLEVSEEMGEEVTFELSWEGDKHSKPFVENF